MNLTLPVTRFSSVMSVTAVDIKWICVEGTELQERYQELHRSMEELRDRQRRCTDMREELTTLLRQLAVRRRELMSQLSAIYPIDQVAFFLKYGNQFPPRQIGQVKTVGSRKAFGFSFTLVSVNCWQA